MVFLALFAIALVPAIVGRVWFHGITWKEFAVHLAAIGLVAGSTAAIIYYRDTSDTEVINGVVIGKEQVSVHCRHSYDCNCRRVCSGSGKNRSCRRVCDTCYEHFNDYDWDVHGSTGTTWSINTVDRQGVIMPPRWASTRVGEPTAETHTYENFIKAAPDSLFRYQGLVEKYKGVLPNYPAGVYNYWHLNRVVQVGVNLPDLDLWNQRLMEINGEVGPKKQVNLAVVVTRKPGDYFYALEEHWVGGKKNDAILVIGLDSLNKIAWAEVMTWTVKKTFEVVLEDEIRNMEFDRERILSALRVNVIKNYRRRPMHDFEYLKASIVPTSTELTVSSIIALLVSIGLMFAFHYHDVFGDE